MSVEVGRLPAILGRELFTTRTEDFHTHSFEDTVVFVIDVERCLDRLHPFDKELVAHIILQEYTEEEACRLLHCGLRTIERRLPDALDYLTEMFLKNGMLNVSEEVCRELTQGDSDVRCRDRVPQRATRVSLHACADSQFESSLVKPTFPSNFPQHHANTQNIILSDVAGLPPSICYAGYVI
jgi:hypothetical protein